MSKYEKLLNLHKAVGKWLDADAKLREFNRKISAKDIQEYDDALAKLKRLYTEIKGE